MAALTHSGGMATDVALVDVSSVTFNTNTRTIVHELIGDTTPYVTVRPAAARTGRLTLIFDSKTAADGAVAIHTYPGQITLDDEAMTLNYVATGTIALTLDPVTRKAWLLVVDFLEVS